MKAKSKKEKNRKKTWIVPKLFLCTAVVFWCPIWSSDFMWFGFMTKQLWLLHILDIGDSRLTPATFNLLASECQILRGIKLKARLETRAWLDARPSLYAHNLISLLGIQLQLLVLLLLILLLNPNAWAEQHVTQMGSRSWQQLKPIIYKVSAHFDLPA